MQVITGSHDKTVKLSDQRNQSNHVCEWVQVITGSHDKTVKLWDLRKGKTMTTLTYHKKSVRGLALHPTEYCFASASAENIKKFRLPRVSSHTHKLCSACKRILTMGVAKSQSFLWGLPLHASAGCL